MAEERADLSNMVDDIVRACQAEEDWWPDPDMWESLHGLAAARAFLDACTDPVRRRWAAEAFHELSPTYVADEPVRTQPKPDRMHK